MTTDLPGASKRNGLGVGLLVFVIWKCLGVLLGLAYLAFGVLWALPKFQTGGAEIATMRSFFVADLVLNAVEIAATLVGISLILRRHRSARLYWIALLVAYCIARVGEALFGLEPFTPAFMLLTGLGWLGYWILGRGPRSLALSRHWTHPS